jgi:hypothetical protein
VYRRPQRLWVWQALQIPRCIHFNMGYLGKSDRASVRSVSQVVSSPGSIGVYPIFSGASFTRRLNIPHRPSIFVGRSEEVDKIVKKWKELDPSKSRRVMLSGLGGTG